MIEFVIIRLGRVGVNVVLIDVIKYAVFFLKASLRKLQPKEKSKRAKLITCLLGKGLEECF